MARQIQFLFISCLTLLLSTSLLSCGGEDAAETDLDPITEGNFGDEYTEGGVPNVPEGGGEVDYVTEEYIDPKACIDLVEDDELDPEMDSDDDGILDTVDNCPCAINPGQEDLDGDLTGNACDTDLDGDKVSNAKDCAPFDYTVHPNAVEACNGYDDNCNNLVDEDPEEGCVLFYPDVDGDSSGALGLGLCLCGPTDEYPTPFGGDCDDEDMAVSSLAVERCDNVDNNCNGLIDEGCDDDGDMYCDEDMEIVGSPTICPFGGGDCFDYSALISPAANEVPGNGMDDNCDGTTAGDGGGEFLVTCPNDCLSINDKEDAYLCAMGMCFDSLISFSEFSSPSGDNHATAHAVVNRFGNQNNDLAPFEGNSYALLATGPATGTFHSEDLSGGGGSDPFGGSGTDDPYASDGYPTFDNVEFKATITAPAGAIGFSIDYIFFSEEYEEYIGTSFNDKFYIFLQAPLTSGGQKVVINTTACSNPNSYYDKMENGQKVCYIAINTAFSEPCPNVPTNIDGTGYECAVGGFDTSATGSSTGWLTTSWPIQGGETFDIIFHIHDSSDGIYDSEVILDNFRFETIPGDFNPGTTSAN